MIARPSSAAMLPAAVSVASRRRGDALTADEIHDGCERTGHGPGPGPAARTDFPPRGR